jgi:hypothetical protein
MSTGTGSGVPSSSEGACENLKRVEKGVWVAWLKKLNRSETCVGMFTHSLSSPVHNVMSTEFDPTPSVLPTHSSHGQGMLPATQRRNLCIDSGRKRGYRMRREVGARTCSRG